MVLTKVRSIKAGFGRKNVVDTGLLLQDDRTNGLMFSRRGRGTVFDDEGDAENAARRYRRAHADTMYKIMGVGRREVDRVRA